MDFSAWVWGIWVTFVVLSFGALETWAIVGGKQEPKTLTEVLRRLLGVEPRKWWRGVASAGLLAVLSWLALHLIWGF